MAALSSEIIIKSETRPCIVCGKNALFHRWSERSEIVPPSVLKGGHSGGVMKWTAAIVEYEDGQVGEVLPCDIKFIDSPHKQHDFSERAKNEEYEQIRI